MTEPLDSSPRPEVSREEVDVRRSPRVWRILALGVGLGAIVAFVLTFALPETEGFSQAQVFGFSLLLFVTLFGALAGLVVVLLDRVVGRRVVRTTAERIIEREESAALITDEGDAATPPERD
ncbi:hypothetical protein [Rathayibacter iranicus]|uniref:Potassium transporter Trk n=2 Tax=Rathayibacter iranicus TaxID=59737 RepID=A0AAD1EN62_9MICO|nr:hypothetical protein [Rathayibacter iranicus]AZZ56803.1 hypothetical protein C7V51_13660 [Rathayibacter iranicus]MWV31987.1 hypothetical protein [Rathayibacter iranicus NCPPB 2253 = VKM Ac-1602]PPI42863.1 hypothetical protein C5E09_12510 [Rathayibacter iranicus]PPI58127.1 hypothetical protein C5E08_13425 [Rathayibacter iranicus]PPI69024.1 hypothetical protein C5E01_12470 [Rathayibacter iranicus]